MRLTRSIMLTILPPLLSACGQMPNAGVSESAKHGRYSGIGLYAPGKLWSEIAPADGEAKRDEGVERADQGAQHEDQKEGGVRRPGAHIVGANVAAPGVAQRCADDRQKGIERADRQIVFAGDHQDTDAERHDAQRRDRLQGDSDIGLREIAKGVRPGESEGDADGREAVGS